MVPVLFCIFQQNRTGTKCLNFFLVNNEFYLVDLPGYGYSTMSEKEKDFLEAAFYAE